MIFSDKGGIDSSMSGAQHISFLNREIHQPMKTFDEFNDGGVSTLSSKENNFNSLNKTDVQRGAPPLVVDSIKSRGGSDKENVPLNHQIK